jgi:hypothetical protein
VVNDVIMPGSIRLKSEKQSALNDTDTEQRNVGEFPDLGKTEVVFLPPKSEGEDYLAVRNALMKLQQSMGRAANELELKTDDDVFNYMKANKKFE